ncbi:MAG: hypothetical protein B7Z54_08200 [Sphingobacteriales bacterium 12-47-4]|nr:MAG: hypothetical protein B7Z54_08200 [Sphingobacteriales bacterium 12-47-4]
MFDVKTLTWFLMTLILMGFFAGIEMAFYSANRLDIELKKKQGKVSGEILDEFVESPIRFLGTTLVGFNIFLVFFGLQISDVMRPIWDYAHVPGVGRILVEIAISTLLVIIFAEFIPRAIFRARSNSILSGLVHIISFFYQIFYPIAAAFIAMSNWILRYLFNIRVDEKKIGDENLNTELFENALEFSKVKIRQCLVPRKEIVGLDIHAPVGELRRLFAETKLSRIVIYEQNIDHLLGYVHQLDMFKNPGTIQQVLLPIPAIPESMSATDLINKFSKERKSIAWVVDEFGGTSGIITMEDILEEIFGEIQDEYDVEEFVEKQIAENEYIFSGRLEVDYLREKYHLAFPPTESETLSGLIINYHETIPQQKDRIIIGDYEFDIVTVSDTRIEMVKMRVLK